MSCYVKSAFFKNKGEVNQKLFDFNFTAYDYDTIRFLFTEIFLSTDYYFKHHNTSPRIIDCGANIGMAILYFKKLYPDAHIMAFEPNPDCFALLEKNITQNNFSNVQLFNIGLTKHKEEIDFFIGNTKGSLKGSILEARGGDRKIVVKTDKLSSFIGSHKFDLIKIDIEGSELEVIEDLVYEGKLTQTERYAIEYHHRIKGAKSNMSQFIKPFEEHNFEYNISTHINKVGAFQDILLKIYTDSVINKQ
jgi:FkbM family methyltransferase